jgi:hypothetical protein
MQFLHIILIKGTKHVTYFLKKISPNSIENKGKVHISPSNYYLIVNIPKIINCGVFVSISHLKLLKNVNIPIRPTKKQE